MSWSKPRAYGNLFSSSCGRKDKIRFLRHLKPLKPMWTVLAGSSGQPCKILELKLELVPKITLRSSHII